MNRIVSTLAVVVLALAFVGHLHGYAVAQTDKLARMVVAESMDSSAVGSKSCDKEAVVAVTGCGSPRADVVIHGVGGSCSFFAVAVSADLPSLNLQGRPVHWSKAAERLRTVLVAPILRPPIFVS